MRFYTTALYLAAEKGNKEIIKLLLTCNELDVNILNIFKNHNIYSILY